MESQKKDIYHNKEKWESWKSRNKKKIKGLTEDNSKFLLEFLKDMENGMNVSARTIRGPRSPTTLINLKDHIQFFLKKLKKPIKKVTKEDLHSLDKRVREGKVKRKDGKPFKAFGNYIKDFKSFWRWLMRTGKVKEDIVIDLSKKVEQKPSWVYLGETKFKNMANSANADYRALIFFMWDTGLRVTEGYSIKVKNFNEDFTKLQIPDEVAKTFGRTINLKICTALIKEYIERNNLGPEDYLIIKKAPAFNKYLREHCKKLFGDKETKARGKYDEFKIYDIRHNASCYWLKRYPNLRGLMYRMGWKREDQAHYYHEFLGMRDEISDGDMVTQEDKTAMEKEIENMKKEFEEMKLYIKLQKKIQKEHEEEIARRPKNFEEMERDFKKALEMSKSK